MNLQTKILFLFVLLISSAAFAKAVTGKDADVMNFAPVADTTKPETDTQEQLSVREEVADEQSEGGSCQLSCHPAFTVFQKTSLAHIDTSKIK